MYKLSTIKKALKLLKKYDYSYCKVSRELGINARTLRCWRKKEINKEPLVCSSRNKKSRWSDEYKKEVTDYYFNHGENIMFLYRKFGQPSYDLMKIWIRSDKRYKKKHKYRKPIKRYSEEEKKEIVVQSALREDSLAKFASNYNLNRATINLWKKEFMAEPLIETTKMTKQELINNIKDLRKEHIKLEMENKILKKANELIKKDLGANFNNLTNRDKTIIISALTPEYKVNNLLKAIKLAKSTYYYELKAILRNKYGLIKSYLKIIFTNNYRCYGYRRMKIALLKYYKINLSEKVVRKLMNEEHLIVFQPKSKRKYSSYYGEITPEVPNIIKRNFLANKPYEKALTDITEFAIPDGKVYLSPIIDCYDGLPISWTIGKSPNSELTNSMLLEAHKILKDNKTIIHSDRGFHYRIPSWINNMNKFGYIRSMSKKGCSPDNSMCEGFFGTIKNEFFYPNNRKNKSCDEFIQLLDEYLNWFKFNRVKSRLVVAKLK